MKKQLRQVMEWHKKYGVFFKTSYDNNPIPYQVIGLRRNVMMEEVKEWVSAAEYQTVVEGRAKELADILYCVFGTIITEGLQDDIEKVFDEVHKSNMTKEVGNKRADGKVLKGSSYVPPSLDFLVKKYG